MSKCGLNIRILNTGNGPVPVLCHEDGEIVKGQVSGSMSGGVEEITQCTITFNVSNSQAYCLHFSDERVKDF